MVPSIEGGKSEICDRGKGGGGMKRVWCVCGGNAVDS